MQNWMAAEAVYAHIYSAMYTDAKWIIKNASIIFGYGTAIRGELI